MDEAKWNYIQQWLDIAAGDLQSARRLASPPDPILDTALFHCQQAAEQAAAGIFAFVCSLLPVKAQPPAPQTGSDDRTK